jgi:hypothetical protein
MRKMMGIAALHPSYKTAMDHDKTKPGELALDRALSMLMD